MGKKFNVNYDELLESRLNGNISDFNWKVKLMSCACLSEFIMHVLNNSNDAETERQYIIWIAKALESKQKG